MQNPLFYNRQSITTYTGVWIVVMVFHILLLSFTAKIPVGYAIADGFVTNILFAAIGIALWFPILYSRTDDYKLINSILYHLFSCLVTVGLWIGVSYFILFSLFGDQNPYITFLKGSLPWRAGIGVLYYGFLILVYYFIIFYRRFRENLVRESELKALVKESELNSLKSQINPHFLFNSLNSISSLTLIQPGKAQEMIIKLSEFLRYSISHKEEKLTNLRDEINNISRYLDIEKIRFGKRLMVDMKGEEACCELKLPGLILQPLVENAVKYGVYENTEASLLEMNYQCHASALIITIRNAYDPDYTYKKGEGIGLKNIRSRLRLMYNRDDLIHIRKDNQFFEVKIHFPQL